MKTETTKFPSWVKTKAICDLLNVDYVRFYHNRLDSSESLELELIRRKLAEIDSQIFGGM